MVTGFDRSQGRYKLLQIVIIADGPGRAAGESSHNATPSVLGSKWQ
jgi:hypothetical protein